MDLSETELQNYLDKYEKFVITDGNWVKDNLLAFVSLLNPDTTVLHRFMMEVNRVMLSIDIDEHLETLGEYVYEVFDLGSVFEEGRISESILLKVLQIASNLLESLIFNIKDHHLYIDRIPTGYESFMKSRICYSITTFDLESITLSKMNLWRY